MQSVRPALSVKFILILLICGSCSINKYINCDTAEDNFVVEIEKIDEGVTKIVGVCYDGKSNKILKNAALNINGVALNTNDGSFEQFVWPGKYEIRVGFTGKKWLLKKIKIRQGEMVRIKFFLKDDKNITLYNR